MRGTKRYKAGAWRLQVKVPRADGTVRYVTATVREPNTRKGAAVADAALARLVLEHVGSEGSGGGEWTVKDWWAHWRHRRRRTMSPAEKSYTDTMGRHYVTNPVYGLAELRLATLKARDLDEFYNQLQEVPGPRGRTFAPATVRRLHNSLRSCLQMAVDDGLIAVNPAARAKLPELPDPLPTPPTPEQVAQLLEYVATTERWGPKYLALLRVLATTGARRGEVVALRWSDLEGGVLTFQRAIAKGPDGWVVQPTKTRNVKRVALDAGTLEALDQWRDLAAKQHDEVGLELDDAWIFYDVPGEWMNPTSLTTRWYSIRDGAGLEGVQLKWLRHYMATMLLDAGVDPKVVAERGGWRQQATMTSYYQAVLAGRDQAAADAIAAITDHPPSKSGGAE